jgi:hypothetical protein
MHAVLHTALLQTPWLQKPLHLQAVKGEMLMKGLFQSG